jgi:hypothetical protein
MDATLILIDSDNELLRARALVDPAMELGRSSQCRSTGGASAPDCRVRRNEVAPAAERPRLRKRIEEAAVLIF